MTGSLPALILSVLSFVGAHFVLSSQAMRDPLVAKIGDGPFIGLYSILVGIPFVWMIAAYRAAPTEVIWTAPIAIKHISLSVMILASMLAVGAISRNNPAVAGAAIPKLEDGPKGIFRITRHPLMWAIALWAITHLMANGDAASIILFSGLAVLALAGAMHIDVRKRRRHGARWDVYAGQSSHMPFVAIAQGRTHLVWSEIGWRPIILGFAFYVAMMVLHEPVIGIAPVSIVSGIFN